MSDDKVLNDLQREVKAAIDWCNSDDNYIGISPEDLWESSLATRDKKLAESQKREAELQNHKRAVLRILEVINGNPTTSVIEQVIALQQECKRLRKALRGILPLAEAYLKSAPAHPDNAKLEDARVLSAKEPNVHD